MPLDKIIAPFVDDGGGVFFFLFEKSKFDFRIQVKNYLQKWLFFPPFAIHFSFPTHLAELTNLIRLLAPCFVSASFCFPKQQNLVSFFVRFLPSKMCFTSLYSCTRSMYKVGRLNNSLEKKGLTLAHSRASLGINFINPLQFILLQCLIPTSLGRCLWWPILTISSLCFI